MSTFPRRIPLFPLPDVVLFPKMPLPLHVYEPRYQKMVRDVLEGHGIIGMTLLEPGWETDYEGRPPVYGIGCAGRLERCDPLEHGRFDVVIRGLIRFRILEEHSGEPYRQATVQPLVDQAGDPALLQAARGKALAAIARANDGPSVLVLQDQLPYDLFVNALCQSLSLLPLERQSLLACNSILTRCLRLIEILEFKRLEQACGGAGQTVH